MRRGEFALMPGSYRAYNAAELLAAVREAHSKLVKWTEIQKNYDDGKTRVPPAAIKGILYPKDKAEAKKFDDKRNEHADAKLQSFLWQIFHTKKTTKAAVDDDDDDGMSVVSDVTEMSTVVAEQVLAVVAAKNAEFKADLLKSMQETIKLMISEECSEP